MTDPTDPDQPHDEAFPAAPREQPPAHAPDVPFQRPTSAAIPTTGDDHLMDRFDQSGTRRFKARDGVIAILIAAIILIFAAGPSIKRQGNEEVSSVGKAAVLAIGDPANALAKLVPVHTGASDMTSFLHPSLNLSGYQGFSYSLASSTGIPAVTKDQFNPTAIGAPAPARTKLSTVLVTGDSMSEPLDQYVAQSLDPDGIKVIQDPHIGTGISSTLLVNWEQLAEYQVKHDHPNAVVIFIGANDGYGMPGPGGVNVNCCGVEWATIYANRVREMMNTYRQDGVAHVYWMLLPTFRDPARNKIATVVNAAIGVAAEPWADQVTVLDTVSIFTPHDTYRDSMEIGGQETIVRQSDGIHLNNAGSQLLSTYVISDLKQNFKLH
jgi:lysophospholipase L1-like esterase